MNRKFPYILLSLCGGIMVIAANYSTLSTRNPESQESYGRLLSNAYRTILNYEKQKGTFANIDYFSAQSNKAISMYNPRPLTTAGIVHNVQKRRELRMQRFDLERFMNGYAGRIAGSDVAMMHAAFDCRVKNIEINPNMDKKCNQIFIHHKQQATAKVDQHLGQANNHINNQQPIQPVITTPQKTKIQQPQPVKLLQPQPIRPQIKQLDVETIIKQDAAQPVNQPVNQPANKAPQPIFIEQNKVNSVHSDTQPFNNKLPLPKPTTDDSIHNQKFNPLKSIHPSLQKQNFGIKPTSSLTISQHETPQENFQFDPITTASVDATNNQQNNQFNKFALPFSSGLILTEQGQNDILSIQNLIKQNNSNNITIIGHADKGNNDSVDMQMSMKRALYIKQILQQNNPNIHINIQGQGSKQPLLGISHYDDKNRRAEIFIN